MSYSPNFDNFFDLVNLFFQRSFIILIDYGLINGISGLMTVGSSNNSRKRLSESLVGTHTMTKRL